MYKGNLITIAGQKIPKIKGYQVGYHKLWSSDSGRTMDGRNSGTLIGIFPKITLKIGELTQDEMADLLSLVNVASQNVTYYDTEYKRTVTDSFYFGDVEDELKRQATMRHKEIDISIIANNPRE